MAFTITTAEVAAALRLSKNTLIRLRASDVLRPAIHYINIGHGKQRACLRWNLDKVEETLARRSKPLPRPRRRHPYTTGLMTSTTSSGADTCIICVSTEDGDRKIFPELESLKAQPGGGMEGKS